SSHTTATCVSVGPPEERPRPRSILAGQTSRPLAEMAGSTRWSASPTPHQPLSEERRKSYHATSGGDLAGQEHETPNPGPREILLGDEPTPSISARSRFCVGPPRCR